MAFARDVFLPADISPGQTDFIISFAYLQTTHVDVFKDGVLQTAGAGNDYIFFNATTIRFNAGLAGTETIVLQRKTNQTARLVNYTVPSTLTEADLDTDSLQGFYMAQEAIDTAALALGLDSTENWDALSKRIKNLAAGTAGTDAVNKNQLDAISAAAGNVPTPDNPGEDNYVLNASGGTWDWDNLDDIMTAMSASQKTAAREAISVITTEGDIITGDASGLQQRLAVGNDGEILRVVGGAPTWVDAMPCGATIPYVGTSAPTAWVIAEGGTIGNASSSGTARANADTEDLFTLFWNSMADSEAPVSSGRGASAAADFAANKNIKLPDFRGRTAIGSGTGPDTAEGGGAGVARTHGVKGGEETHTLTEAELADHRHFVASGVSGTGTISSSNQMNRDHNSGGSFSYTLTGSGTDADRGRTSAIGSDNDHENMSPFQALKYIIKL